MRAALTPDSKFRPSALTSLPISYAGFDEGVSMKNTVALLFLLGSPIAFGAAPVSATAPPPVQKAMKSFRPDALMAHDKFLSGDLLQGRGPGTRGDELAMQYIAAQFQAVGLEPAGDNGTFFQRVPLLGIKYDPSRSNVAFAKEGAPPMSLKYLDDFVATDQSQTESSPLDSELVFVGHGVLAPEYKSDAYKGLDTAWATP